MSSAAILFPKGSEFFNVEGVPVLLVRPPGKLPCATAFPPRDQPRAFPFESLMRNGSPVTEAEFRVDPGLFNEGGVTQ